MSDRPPQAVGSEKALLGCALQDEAVARTLRGLLSDHSFYDERHRIIWNAIARRLDAGQPADLARADLDPTLLPYVEECDRSCHSPANWSYWFEEVADTAKRRISLQDIREAATLIQGGANPDTVFAGLRGMSAEVRPPRGLPAIVNGLALMEEDLPDEPEVIHGVLSSRSKGVLSGCSKAGKTWLLIDAAVSVSEGRPFLGIPTTKGRVLYLNLELKPRTFQKRLRAVLSAKAIESIPLFDVMHLRGRRVSHDSLVPAIIKEIGPGHYSLIIVDPVYKLYGRLKENAAEDMATLTNVFGELAEQTGAAVLYSAHHTKGNQSQKAALDRVSGSGVLARDADALLDFAANETANAFTVEATLREFPPMAPFAVRWGYPLFFPDSSIDPGDLKKPGRKKGFDFLDLLDCISDTTPEEPISVSKWAKIAGIARPTLQVDYLPAMRQKGWIGTIGEGTNSRKYITADGKDALKAALVGNAKT